MAVNMNNGSVVEFVGLGKLSYDLFHNKLSFHKFHELLASFALSFDFTDGSAITGFTPHMVKGAKDFLYRYDPSMFGSDLGKDWLNDKADTYRWYFFNVYDSKIVKIPASYSYFYYCRSHHIVQKVYWTRYCKKWFELYADYGVAKLPF